MRWLPELLIAAAVLIAGYIFVLPKSIHRAPASVYRRYETMKNSDRIIAQMVEDSRHDIAGERFERKVAAARKMDLLNAVAMTCLEKYQRELCVVNLITCGISCKALIPKEQFPKIEADYWSLVDQRHLRSKVRMQR